MVEPSDVDDVDVVSTAVSWLVVPGEVEGSDVTGADVEPVVDVEPEVDVVEVDPSEVPELLVCEPVGPEFVDSSPVL